MNDRDRAPGQKDGFEFTSLGATDQVFPKLKSQSMTQRFFKWGIRLDQDLFIRKFRYNQVFYPVGADDFLKQLLNSESAKAQIPALKQLGDVQEVSFKQMNCTVINMAYFDFLEELSIVNGSTSNINGCIDEYIKGIQCSDKLRTALLHEEDDNYDEL